MINKTYLSRTQTRTMAAEHPIGDPTGGPAFGEKNDPITAVISIASMAGTYGAMMAGSVMAGIAFAGAAISLVGNITGNSTLSKIGMVAGVIGGVGMMGGFGEAAKGATWQNTFGKTVSDEALRGTVAVGGGNTPVVNGQQVAADVVDDAAAAGVKLDSVDTPNINAGNNINTPGGGTNSLTTAPTLSSPVTDQLNPGIDMFGKPNPAMSYPPGAKTPMSFGDVKPGFADSLKTGNYLDAAKAAGSGAMDLLKNNPTGAYLVGQAIGGVADWLSGKTDSEIAALKANTGFADAKAQEIQLAIAKEERKRANMANRYTSISPQANMTVNPDANARSPGLVASNMQTMPG